MKYEKPLIVHSTGVLSAVHGSDPPVKGPAGEDGYSLTQETLPAYSADE